MMTLEEAIKHCKDIALSCTNKECALEHFQLLKWLQEYNNMLEKQGEQKPQGKLALEATNEEKVDNQNCVKPTDKVEHKFKVGDWLTNGLNIRKIIALGTGLYVMERENGTEVSLSINYVEKNYHLWTIEDAKDGDVLKEDSCTFIIERMKPDGTAIIHCCLFDDGDFDSGSTLSFYVDGTYPATKEQRDLLFSKMKDAGYEWNIEKKELKKIKKTPAESSDIKSVLSNIEQKPWGEEDDAMFNFIALILRNHQSDEDFTTFETTFKDCIEWFKNLKDRVQPQPKQEWSEEDETRLTNTIIMLKEGASLHFNKKDITKTVDWLKSLRTQNR